MINGFQHVGMGVWNIETTYAFYKKLFGFRLKLNDITMSSREMEPVVGSVETMRMMMAANLKGGGVIELVEHKSSPIRPFPEEAGYGDFGVLELGIGVRNIEKVMESLSAGGISFLTPLCDLKMQNDRHWRYAYLKDPDGLLVQLVEEVRPGEATTAKPEVHGVGHVGIGVSDMDRARTFYENVLGFDRLVYFFEGQIPEMDSVCGSSVPIRLSILERSAPFTGPVTLLPSGTIKLLQVPDRPGTHVYRDRRWGDIGCMEFCMDVSDMEETVADAVAKGAKVYLQPVEVNMGSGSKGKVAYIRDPDGTVVEFVEIQTLAWLSAGSLMRLARPLLKIYDRFV